MIEFHTQKGTINFTLLHLTPLLTASVHFSGLFLWLNRAQSADSNVEKQEVESRLYLCCLICKRCIKAIAGETSFLTVYSELRNILMYRNTMKL